MLKCKHIICMLRNLDGRWEIDQAGIVVLLNVYVACDIAEYVNASIGRGLIRHLDENLKLLKWRFEMDAHIPTEYDLVRSIIARAQMVISVSGSSRILSRSLGIPP